MPHRLGPALVAMAALLHGCDAPPAQNPMDSTDLETVLSELEDIEWSPENEVLDVQETYVLPVVANRNHLIRIGRESYGYLLYWDGGSWVETEVLVQIPEGWYVGDLKCVGDEHWDTIDDLVPMWNGNGTDADQTP